jgi:CRISPR/Cas system CMR subunit Cmr4 (Cas7 group RAMP superfamily)
MREGGGREEEEVDEGGRRRGRGKIGRVCNTNKLLNVLLEVYSNFIRGGGGRRRGRGVIRINFWMYFWKFIRILFDEE